MTRTFRFVKNPEAWREFRAGFRSWLIAAGCFGVGSLLVLNAGAWWSHMAIRGSGFPLSEVCRLFIGDLERCLVKLKADAEAAGERSLAEWNNHANWIARAERCLAIAFVAILAMMWITIENIYGLSHRAMLQLQ